MIEELKAEIGERAASVDYPVGCCTTAPSAAFKPTLEQCRLSARQPDGIIAEFAYRRSDVLIHNSSVGENTKKE